MMRTEIPNVRLRVTATACALIATFALVPSGLFAQASADRGAAAYRDSYALEAKGDYAGALARARDAQRAGSEAYFASARIGWLAYLAGKADESVAAYTDAIKAEPKAVEPRIGLTLPLLAAARWRELERACTDALALDSTNATALARIAIAYYSLGNYGDAATAYRRLTQQYPSTLDYRTGLGWAYVKLGRLGEARALFEAVLAVSPDNASAKQGMAVRG